MNKKTALDFVAAINSHNTDKIAALMAADHVFKVWQVYADSKIPFDIMNGAGNKEMR